VVGDIRCRRASKKPQPSALHNILLPIPLAYGEAKNPLELWQGEASIEARREVAGARSAVSRLRLLAWRERMVRATNNHWKGAITPIVEEDAASHQRDGWHRRHPQLACGPLEFRSVQLVSRSEH
jgi:hypothetical protein